VQQVGHAVAGNHRAMQGTCTESLHLILGQRSRKNIKTIGKHREVVENQFTVYQ